MKKTIYIWAIGLALPLLLGGCNSKNAAKNTGNEDSTAVAAVSDPSIDDETLGQKQEEGIWEHFAKWTSTPLTTEAKDGKVTIYDFARTFCNEYSGFEPCEQLLSYLKDPKGYDSKKTNFYVRDAPKNGYIQCFWDWEFANTVTLCYWNRKNGHLLVGATVERGFEADEDCKYQYMFYDYDKANGQMTPDLEIKKAFDTFGAKFRHMYACLPEEGKDCYVSTWTKGNDDESEDDNTFKEYQAKWDGMTFTFGPSDR